MKYKTKKIMQIESALSAVAWRLRGIVGAEVVDSGHIGDAMEILHYAKELVSAATGLDRELVQYRAKHGETERRELALGKTYQNHDGGHGLGIELT